MSAVANFAKLATAPAPTKRPVRQSLLSVREKIDAIDRVHEGESKAAVARDIGVPESTLRGWCKTEDKLRSLARACEGSDTPPSDLDKDQRIAGLDQDPYSPEPKRFRVESENKPATSPEVDDALLYWLKQQQQHVGLAMNEHLLDAKMTAEGADNSSWFWRWYKQYGVQAQPLPLAERAERTDHSLGERTLERNLECSPPQPDYCDRDYDTPLSLVKRDRDNLDHVKDNSHDNNHDNNNVTDLRKHRVVESEDEDDEPPETAAEAVKHGERFLRWLECCSDPSVTALQILQFRYLLNNVRACADRRARQVKSKDRERSRRK